MESPRRTPAAAAPLGPLGRDARRRRLDGLGVDRDVFGAFGGGCYSDPGCQRPPTDWLPKVDAGLQHLHPTATRGPGRQKLHAIGTDQYLLIMRRRRLVRRRRRKFLGFQRPRRKIYGLTGAAGENFAGFWGHMCGAQHVLPPGKNLPC